MNELSFFNEELLKECFKTILNKKVIGLNQSTKKSYLIDLDKNIKKLKEKKYIPCLDKAKPYLFLETKIVLLATKKIIERIYEPKLPEEMYGTRKDKTKQDALQKIKKYTEKNSTNYIIKFNIDLESINKEKLIKYLSFHIKNPAVINLIKNFLNQGILEKENTLLKKYELIDNTFFLTNTLYNIYTYYEIIKDIEKINYINYYDETILFLDTSSKSKLLYEKLLKKIKKENICYIHIRPKSSFDFLGFVHYLNKNFKIERKTESKVFSKKLVEFNRWCKKNNHRPLNEIMDVVKVLLIRHYNYYGIKGNSKMIKRYYKQILNILFKWLNRRSERKSYTRKEFTKIIKKYNLPKPYIKKTKR